MKYLIPIILVSIIGCAPVDIKKQDQCLKARKVCWGQQGTNPIENPVCKRLLECYDWEITEKK